MESYRTREKTPGFQKKAKVRQKRFPNPPSGVRCATILHDMIPQRDLSGPTAPPAAVAKTDWVVWAEVMKLSPPLLPLFCRQITLRSRRHISATPFALFCSDLKGYIRDAIPLSNLHALNYVRNDASTAVLFCTVRLRANEVHLPDILVELPHKQAEHLCNTIYQIKQRRGEVSNNPTHQTFLKEAPTLRNLLHKAHLGKPKGYDVSVTHSELLALDKLAEGYTKEYDNTLRGVCKIPMGAGEAKSHNPFGGSQTTKSGHARHAGGVDMPEPHTPILPDELSEDECTVDADHRRNRALLQSQLSALQTPQELSEDGVMEEGDPRGAGEGAHTDQLSPVEIQFSPWAGPENNAREVTGKTFGSEIFEMEEGSEVVVSECGV